MAADTLKLALLGLALASALVLVLRDLQSARRAGFAHRPHHRACALNFMAADGDTLFILSLAGSRNQLHPRTIGQIICAGRRCSVADCLLRLVLSQAKNHTRFMFLCIAIPGNAIIALSIC